MSVGQRICQAMLWTPFARRPNLLSVFFSFARMAVLSAVFVLALAAGGVALDGVAANAAIWAVFVLLEECARLSLILRADDKWRAGMMFLFVVIVVESVGLYRPDVPLPVFALWRLPTVALHALYTWAMIWLTEHRQWLPAGFGGLVFVHWLYDVFASSISL